jgi:DNA-binding LytR/AlgR family response regulator
MVNICIVEDELDAAHLLKSYINKYGEAKHQKFEVTHLSDGMDLVDDYKGQFDIILLDIQMKFLDGMAAAEKIRKLDSDVVIIFITSTVQYAVQGYAVDALGYVLKPVPYTQFEQIFDKAIIRVQARQQHVYIKVSIDDGRQLKLDCNNVIYIESQRNNVIIHCLDNSYVTQGPLKRFDEMLMQHGFSKCHNAYLINLSCVHAVQKEEVVLSNDVTLPISRARKKEFMAALTEDIL